MENSKIILNNGYEIPKIGIGPGIPGYIANNRKKPSLFGRIERRIRRELGLDSITERKYEKAVANALEVGFRLIDYSSSYGDGHLIRDGINDSKIDRKKLFITTRISNASQTNNTIREDLFKQLRGLNTNYVDLLQFHWPVKDRYLNTWNEMVKLYEEGYCKSIGVANCNIHHLEDIIAQNNIIPAINQIEVHPLFTQKELIRYCNLKNIVVEAYTPVARMDDRLFRLPSINRIAEKYHKSVVQIILRWHIQNGIIPIIRSLNKNRQKEDIDVFNFDLSTDEIAIIDNININSRLRYDPDNCDFDIL